MKQSYNSMKFFLKILIFAFAICAILSFLFIVFNPIYFNTSFLLDKDIAYSFGGFFGGYVGTLFTILNVLLITYSIYNQNQENKKNDVKNHFFKMIDYHIDNVKELSISHVESEKDYKSEGRRAFVIYKIQLKRLLQGMKDINSSFNLNLKDEEIIDIAYMIFYYGLDKKWTYFISEKLSKYNHKSLIIKKLLDLIEESPQIKLGRTNQTGLSGYFRNMYNAVKLVDDSKYLTTIEKQDLIKIYRAQLSNPELYVLFFNLVSRFGKKWKEKDFIVKYKYIKNIPNEYCDGFDPRKFFPIQFEDDEYND